MSPRHPAEVACYAEVERHIRAVAEIVARWPAYRAHLAYGLLGQAVAVDSFGLDVEAFVAELRQREPRPAMLVPPREGQS